MIGQANTSITSESSSCPHHLFRHASAKGARTPRVSELITVALLFAFTLGRLDAHLLVVLLKGGKVFTSFTELALFHPFSYIPVHKCTFAVHQIKLVVDAGEHFGNRRGVADHAACTHDLGQVSTGHDSWWLVVDAALEAGRGPVDKLDSALGLDGGDGRVHVLRHHITAVHHAACHVLAVAWVTLDKHAGGLKHGHGNLCHGELLVVGLLCRDDRCVAGKHEVDAWVWHQVGLKFGNVDIECAIEAQGGCEGRDDLRQETVQVCVCGPLDVQVSSADVIERLVVVHDRHIGVLQQGVNTENRVVGFDDGGCDLGAGPDGEAQLGLLAVIDGEALQHEAAETTASTTTDCIVDHEALQAC